MNNSAYTGNKYNFQNPLKSLEANLYSGTLQIENLNYINKLYETMVETITQNENMNCNFVNSQQNAHHLEVDGSGLPIKQYSTNEKKYCKLLIFEFI